MQAEPLIGAVISLDRHLEGFRFAQFWSEADRLREILNPGVYLCRFLPHHEVGGCKQKNRHVALG